MKLKLCIYIDKYIYIYIYIFTKYITKGGCVIAAGDALSFTNASFRLGGRSMRNGQNRNRFYSLLYIYYIYMYSIYVHNHTSRLYCQCLWKIQRCRLNKIWYITIVVVVCCSSIQIQIKQTDKGRGRNSIKDIKYIHIYSSLYICIDSKVYRHIICIYMYI